MSDQSTHLDASRERLLEETLQRRHRDLDRRERLGNRLQAGLFLLAAVLLALLADAERSFSPGLAALFVAAYALVGAVEVWGDTCNAVPTQIVFVPMLLLLPTPYVPLLVAGATVLTAAGQALRGGTPLGRSALAVGDAWFSVGPALVLIALGAQHAGWHHWWVYGLALAAQLLCDGVATLSRLRILHGTPPKAVLPDLLMVYRVDLLLFPIGLLAAVAAAGAPAAALLVLPLAYLLLSFSLEREASMRKSLELGRAYRGTALLLRDLLEEDDEYTGRHTEDVVGLSVSVAERMGLDEDTRRSAELGALLHGHRQDRRARRDHQQAGPAQRRGVGDHEDPHRRGRAHAGPGGRPAGRRRPRRARLARALGRRRLPGRSRRRADPARRLHHLRLRRVQRDDHRPVVPQGAPALRRRRRAPEARRHAVLPRGGRGARRRRDGGRGGRRARLGAHRGP